MHFVDAVSLRSSSSDAYPLHFEHKFTEISLNLNLNHSEESIYVFQKVRLIYFPIATSGSEAIEGGREWENKYGTKQYIVYAMHLIY